MRQATKALMYADWCVARRSIRPYVISSVVIAGVVSVGQVVGQDMVCMAVTTSFASCMALVLMFNVMFLLFGIDDQGDWAQDRFALLPITRTDAVRARYAMVSCVLAASLTAAVPLGALYPLAAAALTGLPCRWEAVPEMGIAVAAILLVGLGIVSLQMPILFAQGLQRGRMMAVLPFMAFVALGFAGDALTDQTGEVIEALLALPTPALVGGTLALCVALYLASMLVSQRLYAKRQL